MIDKNIYYYVYRITHIESGYHYYGGRYKQMQNRFSYDALEDLKQYQSSSSNIQWKNRIRNYPEEFKFKIIKKFSSPSAAYYYEAKLHNKFKVNTNSKFINRRCESTKIISNEILNKIYDIYTWSDNIIHQKLSFFDAIPLSKHMSLLLSGEVKYIDGYYTDISLLIKHYTIINLYTYDISCHKIITHKVYYKDLYNYTNNTNIMRLINGQSKYVDIWYINKQDIMNDYKIITLYTWEHKLMIHTIFYKDLNNYTKTVNIYSVLDGLRISANGFYSNYKLCLIDNRMITLYNKYTQLYITVNIKESKTYISSKYAALFNRRIHHYNGYILYSESIEDLIKGYINDKND